MTRTTFARLRAALLLAATGAMLLTGCTDSVTRPEVEDLSNPTSTGGRGEVEQPYRIKDPDVTVGVVGGSSREHYRVTDPNVTVDVR